MSKKFNNLPQTTNLRERAEAVLTKVPLKSNSLASEADSLKLIHELQVHQIELEMQNDELLQAKELAEAATKKATELFDFAPSGYFTVARNGEIIEINLTGAKLLQKDRFLLKNKLLTHFIASSSKPVFNRFLYTVFESRTKQSCEIEVSSNGSSTHISLTGLVIENSPYCWLTGENITELKQTKLALQRSESRFKNMFYRHNAIMLLIDPESGRIMDANESATQFYGYSRSKLLSMRIEEINSLSADHVKIEFKLAAKEAKNYFIFNHRLSNGEKRIVEVHSSPIVIEGQRVLYSIIHDITDRRRAEEALVESEEKFRTIFENSLVATSQTFFDGTFNVNHAFCEISGYSEDELSTISWQSITHSDDLAGEESIVNAILSGEKSFARREKRYIHKNGNIMWVDISTALLRDKNGIPQCFITSILDITKQKLAEETIKRSETILRLFIEHSPAAIAMFDCQMRYIAFSRRFLIDYELDEQNIIGRTHYEVFPEIPQRWRDIHNRCLAGSTDRCDEDPFLRRSGNLEWVKWEICPWHETDNKIGGIILFSEVVTERKLDDEKLRTSVQLTRNIIDNTPSLFYLVDLEGKFVLVNQKLETILGVPGEKLIGNTRESFLTKEIADQHRANDLIVIESRQALTFEEENLEPDGKHIYLTQKFPLLNSDGAVYAIGGISTDITENRHATDSLKASEAKWHNLFEILPVGVSIVDLNNQVTNFNPALSQILNITNEGLLKGEYRKRIYLRPDLEVMSDEEFPSTLSLREKKIIRDVKIGIKKEDGSVIWTIVSAAPLINSNETVIVTTDITKSKLAEEELRKSEEKWRSLVFNSPDFIALLDREGRFLFLNRYPEGFSEKDVLGKISFDNISIESNEIFRTAFEKCIIEMTKQEIEYRAMDDNRETRTYESSLVPFLVKDNEFNVLVVAREITQRIKATEEVRKSKEQLVELYKNLNEVREEERTSISREIHDDLGQSLAGLKIDLIGIKEDLNDKLLPKHKIDKAISLVDATIKTVRKISSELRPQMLDELGLASAIEWQSNEFKKRTGIKCKLKLEEIEDISENAAISLFRIFQAAMTNIMLHSKATSVSVKLETKEQMIQLRINDDGIGITHEQLNSAKSFGLIGMRERANQINGNFEIKTGVNSGTEIIVSVPVK